MTTGRRGAGDFCWFNMLTPQPAPAREFFGKLLGWTYSEIPGMGHTVSAGGKNIGALFDLDGPGTPPGTQAHIGVMIKVENAGATCAKVVALGGSAGDPFDIMGNLRMAVCKDPDGAGFDLFEPGSRFGTDVDIREPGAANWFELKTADTGRAAKFYSDLFGWQPNVLPMPGLEYTTFQLGDSSIAGLMRITPAMGAMRPHWGVYYTVRNVDDAAREAVALGATIVMALRDIPGGGRICGFTSPQGVDFSVIQCPGA